MSERTIAGAEENGIAVLTGLESSESASLLRAGQVAAEGVSEAGDIASASSKWAKLAAVTEGVARVVTILALAAACVVTGFQTAQDFASDQPVSIKVLDITEIVANGVAFLAEAGAGIAALAGIEVASCVPVIGVVAAFVGIAVAIALLFIHRKPPPTKEEIFMTDEGVPFLNSKPEPPQKWLDNEAAKQKHLKEGN